MGEPLKIVFGFLGSPCTTKQKAVVCIFFYGASPQKAQFVVFVLVPLVQPTKRGFHPPKTKAHLYGCARLCLEVLALFGCGVKENQIESAPEGVPYFDTHVNLHWMGIAK